ncbi:hypothetical protein [Demequina sp.]|uniref:hypothetical protein n=1 Tax=Demequina sp. TaxID=2050685 RepID=UPI003A86DBB9
MDDSALIPPQLYLPYDALLGARDYVDEAMRALSGAGDVEWVSAAAGRFRTALAVMHGDLNALAADIEYARGRWIQAREAAQRAGQL